MPQLPGHGGEHRPSWSCEQTLMLFQTSWTCFVPNLFLDSVVM